MLQRRQQVRTGQVAQEAVHGIERAVRVAAMGQLLDEKGHDAGEMLARRRIRAQRTGLGGHPLADQTAGGRRIAEAEAGQGAERSRGRPGPAGSGVRPGVQGWVTLSSNRWA